MYKSAVYLVIVSIAIVNGDILDRLQNYTKIFGFSSNDINNELWTGIIRDCSKKVTFSCIQKNAYSYLDRTFIDSKNITVFEGLSLTRNNLDYENCKKDDPKDNVVEDANGSDDERSKIDLDDNELESEKLQEEEKEQEEYLSPLEEITYALRKKTIKFLATRDYKIQLPKIIGDGASLKISPREIDANGALIRIDFDSQALEEQPHARFFLKKLKKKLADKLIMTVVLIVLLIKILKIKFMFVIPFLFGIGTAKKLFLKLLLFFVPAFAHVFKLCSSYYSSHATKYHHHHHKIAHHHHHIPVPVPVYSSKPSSSPIYLDHPPPSSSSGIYFDHPPSSHSSSGPIILDEDFQGYDYAHPHIQYRKDIEELKEWGIEPYEDSYDQIAPQAGVIYPGPSSSSDLPSKSNPKFPGPFGIPPPFAVNSRPSNFAGPKFPPPSHPQNLAYSGYRPPMPPPPINKQSPPPPPSSVSLPAGMVSISDFRLSKSPVTPTTNQPNYNSYIPQSQLSQKSNQPTQQRYDLQQQNSDPIAAAPAVLPPAKQPYDDEFYGPIVKKLDEIFGQLRFLEESCRERLVCSMYKNPALYSPHSNLVSNELSRDPQELQQGNAASSSSQRFNRYLNAARIGQDGGDCLRTYPCGINTE
ncbi:uncharacterized protein LOC131665639 [Phymastichus coffea]|uniref:uncharacterized protein LOC131665639 n=1 Tax=Phymastichus coffea TaxID=108790 RepID=UPI00273BCB08|nr:uncharacterized protein LOC131665639 [Phymastichus coffea]